MTIAQKISLPKESLIELNDRDIGYRFDIHSDIPWEAPNTGRLFTGELFELFGFDKKNLQDPDSTYQIEWCWALAICNIFIFFEKDIIGLIRDSKNKIDQSVSSAYLIEEEVKHVRLFKKMAKKLESEHPEWVDTFYESYQDPQVYNVPFAQRSDLERIEQHQFLIWLYTLFFENFTIYLHEKLIPAKQQIQATWYRAQECHRIEEEEHVRTDQAYLELCDLSAREKKSLGKEFFLLLSFNYESFFGLDTCHRFFKSLNKGSIKSIFTVNEFTDLPFFKDIITHPVFASSRAWAEVLVDYYNELELSDKVQAIPVANSEPLGKPISLIELIETTAALYPEKTLNILGFNSVLETYTYQQLIDNSKKRASQLVRDTGDANYILLYFPDITSTLSWFWASLYSGKTPIVLAFSGALGDLNEESNRLRKILGTLPNVCVLTEQEYVEDIKRLDKVGSAKILSVEKVLKNVVSDYVPVSCNGNDEAVIQFSSGSTGDPKGISLSHENILTNADQMIKACQVTSEDRFLNWMPLHHDMGLIGYHLTPIVAGSSQFHIHPVQFMKSPGLWPNLVSEYCITKSGITNSALKNIIRWGKSKKSKNVDLSSLNSVIVGAEPIQVSTIEGVKKYLSPLGLESHCLTPAYGMAEASLALTFKEHAKPYSICCFDRNSLSKGLAVVERPRGQGIEMISLGKPVSNLEIQIADENCNELPEGTFGFVRFKGANVSRGFWRKGEFSSVLDQDGWFTTNDLGLIKNGELYLLGRADEVFYLDGKNYFLSDIDNVVEALDFVKAGGCAAVVDPFSAQSPENVVVFVDVLAREESDARIQLDAVRREITRKMGIEVGMCASLPRRLYKKTTSGKIKRFEMFKDFSENFWGELVTSNKISPNRSTSDGASDAIEQAIAKLWSEVLGVTIEAHQWDMPFQDLGGTSLKALAIHNELEELLNKPLNPSWLITKNTINQMARALKEKGLQFDTSNTDCSAHECEPTPIVAPTISVSAALQTKRSSLIAIVGVGVRYPGVHNLSELADALETGKTQFREMSDKRWQLIAGDENRLISGKRPWGSFLEGIENFDHSAFGVSAELAVAMDPQVRIFLELAADALSQTRVSSQKVGVFAAGGDNEYMDRLTRQADYNQSTLSGSLQNMLAAQVSRTFDFSGPALKVNTACSSSLYAVHLAAQSLLSGESNIALAGGVQINLTDNGFKAFDVAGLLKQDGPATPFGNGESGLVPGEGGAIVVLKRLEDAEKDNDDIIAVIRATSTNNDGPSLSGTSPNPNGQIQLLEDLYKREGLTLGDLDYFEAHAAGTAIGDGIEVGALQSVNEKLSPQTNNRIPIGSSKSFFGHTLSASGITSLVKVLASLKSQRIPATIVGGMLTERIDFDAAGVKPLLQTKSWPRSSALRRVGINSLGLGGTNVHAIIEDYERPEPAKTMQEKVSLPAIVSLGGATKAHLKQQAVSVSNLLEKQGKPLLKASLLADQFVKYRTLIWEFGDKRLSELVLQHNVDSLAVIPNNKPKIAFVYPGPGSQFKHMGKIFYDSMPVFREAINQCHEFLNRQGFDLLDYLYGEAPESELLRIDISQPIVFSFSYALTQLLTSLKVLPDLVLGHSAGEYAAAVTAGIMSLEEGLESILKRGQFMAATEPGAMAAVHAFESQITPILSRYSGQLWLASFNCPEQCAVSGDESALEQFLLDCEQAGIDATKLDIGCAAHTRYMKPAALRLQEFLQNMRFKDARIPFLSTSDLALTNSLSAAYFSDQLVNPVLFHEAVNSACHFGIDLFVEVSSTSGLAFCISKILPEVSHRQTVSMALRGQTSFDHTLSTLNALYMRGVNIELERLSNDPLESVYLSRNYIKKDFWVEPRKHENHVIEITKNASNAERFDTHKLTEQDLIYAEHHLIEGKKSAPFGVLMDILAQDQRLNDRISIKNIVFLSPLYTDSCSHIIVDNNHGELSIVGSNEHDILIQGSVLAAVPKIFSTLDLNLIKARCNLNISPTQVYQDRLDNGLEIGESLKAMKSVSYNDREALVELRDPESNTKGRCIQAALVDSAMQATTVFFSDQKSNETFLGFGIDSWIHHASLEDHGYAYIQLKSMMGESEIFKFDIIFCSDSGEILSELIGFSAKKVTREVRTNHVADTDSVSNSVSDSNLEPSFSDVKQAFSVEQTLFALVSKYTNQPIGPECVDEAFSNMGINSIKAVKIAKEIEGVFGIKLPATLLFETPSMRTLLQAITRRLP